LEIKVRELSADEMARLASKEPIIDPKAVVIGLVVFVLLGVGAFTWRIKLADRAERTLEKFVFRPEEPQEEEMEIKEPQQEILTDTVEEFPDEEQVPETPDIQVSVDPVELVVDAEVIQTENVEVSEDIAANFTDMDIPDAPEEVLDLAEETLREITPIAVLSPKPSELFSYKNPKPLMDRRSSLFAAAPKPGEFAWKFRPAQWGEQDAPTAGEPGPMNLNMNGVGALMTAMGRGGMEVRHSVDSAIRWLALHQEPDGSWHGAKWNPEDCPAGGDPEAKDTEVGRAGITGLALMALTGGGHTTQRGEYRANVLRGMEWIMKRQNADGMIAKNMYEHAMCTIALCEAHGRAPDDRIGRAARKAAYFIVKGVNPDYAWRYSANCGISDLSVSAWVIQALKAAKLARIKIDNTVFSRSLLFVDNCTSRGGTKNSDGTVGYQADGGGTPSMTAAGMLIREFVGMGAKASLLQKGAQFLKKYPPNWSNRDVYQWYYATYAMHNMGGEHRLWWNARTSKVLLDNQSKDGHQAGSWNPEGDRWSKNEGAGRVYCTALSALCLEVYYRYGESLRTFGTAPDLDDLFFE
jgi:hypothetical protein